MSATLRNALILVGVGLGTLGLALFTEWQSSADASPAVAPPQMIQQSGGLEIPRPSSSSAAEINYPAGREPMALPANYAETLLHYATVDRSDGITRNLYISLAAIEALARGEDFPERTQVVIEAFAAATDPTGRPLRDAQGRLIPAERDPEIHMAERRSTWRLADLSTTSRLGDWNFGAFDYADGAPVTDAFLSDCFSCHESAHRREFVFSLRLMLAYAETGEVQYQACNRPDRAICP